MLSAGTHSLELVKQEGFFSFSLITFPILYFWLFSSQLNRSPLKMDLKN